MNTIPVEILERIFSFTCESTYSLAIDNALPSGQVTSDLFAIFHACSRWRAIVSDYSKLWTSLYIRKYKLVSKNMEMIRMFLENSQKRPLHLHITKRHQEATEDEDDSELWETLKPHLSRCRKLVLDADDFDSIELPLDDAFSGFSFDELVEYEAPRLRVYRSDVLYNAAWWEALRNAPKLTTVQVSGVPTYALPYGQLKTLGLSDLRAKELPRFAEEVAPLCTQLEHLELGFVGSEAGTSVQRIPLPTLRTMAITGSWQVSLKSPVLIDIFASVSAPSLERLSLRLGCHYQEKGFDEPWPAAFLGMLHRSSESLGDLSLDFVGYGGSEEVAQCFSSLLEEIPQVRSLRLEVGSGQRGILNKDGLPVAKTSPGSSAPSLKGVSHLHNIGRLPIINLLSSSFDFLK